MTGLASHLVDVAIELDADQLGFGMGPVPVAGFARRDVAAQPRFAGASGVLGVNVIAAAREDVLL